MIDTASGSSCIPMAVPAGVYGKMNQHDKISPESLGIAVQTLLKPALAARSEVCRRCAI